MSEVVLLGNPGTTDDPAPTESGTWPASSQYDISRYTVQAWSGSAWQTVASVSGNTKHIVRLAFAPVTTDRIRVIPVDDASNGQSANDNLVSLTEIEVRTPAGAGEIRTQRFDAWGKLEQAAGSVPTYGYTGREPDATGLTFYRARYYHPELGRFVSRDPLGLSAGINPYAYADGNPVLFNDPDGLMAAGAWNSVSSYWTSTTNSVGSFLSGIDAGGAADQFGRRLANDFVQNNPSRAGDLSAQGWVSRQLAPYAQGYDGSTANGQAAGMLVFGLGMTLPSDPGRKLDRVEGAVDAVKGVRAGEAGAYGSLKGVKGDGLTAHHMPQAAAGRTGYNEGGALVMEQAEHVATRTYGSKGVGTVSADAELSFREVLARDIRDVRSIVGSKYNEGLRALIEYYRENFPDLMSK